MYVRSWKCHGDKDMLIYETEWVESFLLRVWKRLMHLRKSMVKFKDQRFRTRRCSEWEFYHPIRVKLLQKDVDNFLLAC